MKKEIRKCVVCGKKFTPKAAHALTCSKECYKVRKAAVAKIRKAKKKEDLPVSTKAVKKVEKKSAVKKTVKETVVLPKKKDVIVNKGDVVLFKGFSSYEMIDLAINVIVNVLQTIKKGAEKAACKCNGKCKKEVKPIKKATKKVAKK